MRLQFEAWSRHVAQHHPGAERSIVIVDGERAGRFDVHCGDECVLVVDVSLLPAQRGRGVGTVLLRWVGAQAAELGLPVRLRGRSTTSPLSGSISAWASLPDQ